MEIFSKGSRKILKHGWKVLSLLVILAGIGTGIWFYTILYQSNPGNKGEAVTVLIPRGTSAQRIAALLKEKKIIRNPETFLWAAKLHKARRELKAGLYRLPLGESNSRLVEILRAGKVTEIKVSLPEGIRSQKMASIFHQKIGVDSTTFMKLVNDTSFARTLGVDANSLEGYLFPNTYFFPYGVDARMVIQTLVRHFWEAYTDSLKERTRQIGWTVHEVVTLASIIEGEAKIDRERPLISAVYHNRLKRGMLLQASPTIQFLLPNGPRRLLKKDLEIDSPYNTYKYPGLPPGPINNPGMKSIRAALYPAPVKYLYFVARGDGSHIFTYTLQQHLRAKRTLDRLRRNYYRKHRQKG
ncbi:MAG: endolytic transglycosylase MltG [Calditrichaeota bacterium]|nr:endolytic transglycosylase MltG [Calditrichota bacterium]